MNTTSLSQAQLPTQRKTYEGSGKLDEKLRKVTRDISRDRMSSTLHGKGEVQKKGLKNQILEENYQRTQSHGKIIVDTETSNIHKDGFIKRYGLKCCGK